MKHIVVFTFYTSNDYNSFIIKICLFLFSFSLYLTVNALFFTDSTIHKIYEDNWNFNFIYQIPQILYSVIISTVLNSIISFLSLTQNYILKIKNYEKKDIFQRSSGIKKYINIKFIFFFILLFIFLLFFWFFLSCFCSVYQNTQIHLIKDTLFSYGLSLLYPFGINLLPGIFRINSLKDNKGKKYMYNISKIFQLL